MQYTILPIDKWNPSDLFSPSIPHLWGPHDYTTRNILKSKITTNTLINRRKRYKLINKGNEILYTLHTPIELTLTDTFTDIDFTIKGKYLIPLTQLKPLNL